MWKLFQIAAFVFVMGTNIEYRWTPNNYAAATVAIFVAFIATVILGSVFRMLSRLQRWDHRAH